MMQFKLPKNVLVEEFTTPSPVTAGLEDTIQDVSELMSENEVRHIPIVAGKQVVGILSDRDICVIKSCYSDVATLKVNAVMKGDPYIVDPNTPIEEVVFYMSKEKIGSAIVYSREMDYLGIFTLVDALNSLIEIIRGNAEAY